LPERSKRARFEEALLPHLDAAYNLARWLLRDDHDAEDMVQEAFLRAFRFFDRFQGGDSRAWLLAVVRNTCYTWLKQNRARDLMTPFDERLHGSAPDDANPEYLFQQKASAELLREALEELPVEYREILVLRELEGFSYREIASIADIPLGTVMSRLTRARTRLQQGLGRRLSQES
jgi:RNA polymerase sigma-70 factor (ECF subfamily)